MSPEASRSGDPHPLPPRQSTSRGGWLAKPAGAAISVLSLLTLLILAVYPPPAGAAFPGQNGWIVFASDYATGPRFDSKYNWNIWKLDPATYDADFPRRDALIQLTRDNNQDQVSPSFSPDGRMIVYSESRGGDKEIMLMNADGSDKKQLSKNSRQDRQPVFSPDGKRIAFASSRSGETEIWVMRADGGGERRLTTFSAINKTTGQSANPQFSPDGSQVLFQGTTYKEVPWGQDALYRVDSDAANPQAPRLVVNLYGVYRMRGFAFNATGTRAFYGVSESRATRIRDQLITGLGLPDLRAFDPNWGPFNIYETFGDGGCGLCQGAWVGDKLRLFPGKRFYGDPRNYPNSDYAFPAVSPEGDAVVFQGLGRMEHVGIDAPLLVIHKDSRPHFVQIDVGGGGHWAQIQPDWGPQPRP